MENSNPSTNLQEAQNLLEDFAERTEISGKKGDLGIRYLWTDAFAVQALFGLHKTGEKKYKDWALRLIDLVHKHLGKYHPQDEREGWISGLIAEKGKLHPTIGGLRIGKKLPERKKDESYNPQLEWERDGQYFHYITRWITALLQAKAETGESKYATWAAELMLAAEKFIYLVGSAPSMHWKMNTELSRPLVASTGAHDPLEGLICVKSIQSALSENMKDLDDLGDQFEIMCEQRHWTTSDSLGIGGLLLNTLRSALLTNESISLPASVKPEKLLDESISSFRMFSESYNKNENAGRRLAFRECGLSLGLHAALLGMKDKLGLLNLPLGKLEEYKPIAREIESFWLDPENQRSPTWKEHLDINAISLASSLIAQQDAAAFSGIGEN